MAKIEGRPEYRWSVEELLSKSDGTSPVKMLHPNDGEAGEKYLAQVENVRLAAEFSSRKRDAKQFLRKVPPVQLLRPRQRLTPAKG